jgi:hypothetical protein
VTALAGAGLLFLVCASDHRSPHPDLARVWHDYLTLPAERALAIAGDPRRDRWVTGASGGHASREEAEERALAECRRRRAQRRMQDACQLYAVGDEIVWSGPE